MPKGMGRRPLKRKKRNYIPASDIPGMKALALPPPGGRTPRSGNLSQRIRQTTQEQVNRSQPAAPPASKGYETVKPKPRAANQPPAWLGRRAKDLTGGNYAGMKDTSAKPKTFKPKAAPNKAKATARRPRQTLR
jgi:hypothetical protein